MNTKKSILIVEDENYQAELLSCLIEENAPNMFVAHRTANLNDTTDYLKFNTPDLIFMDIVLEGQLCFEVFNKVKVTSPVIYTTSYKDFAFDSYYRNGIHYLIKPLTKSSVIESIGKYQSLLSGDLNPGNELIYKNDKLLIKTGKFTNVLDIKNIDYIFLQDKLAFIKEKDKKHTFYGTLDELENKLGIDFFRINRQLIVNINQIERYSSEEGGKIKVYFKSEELQKSIVSYKRRKNFLSWISNQ